MFQVFECQNGQCRLRFPSNLSVAAMEKCPLCGSPMLPSGGPFSNAKLINKTAPPPMRRINLLLDNLRSTHNVGSIFRTANGAAINHIFCCGTSPTPGHPKFSKSALNSDDTVSWSTHRNSLDVIHEQKRQNIAIVSLEVTAQAKPIFSAGDSIQQEKDILLIVGNEVSGIDPALIDESDAVVYIPMLGSKTSLNVSIAAAIAIYEYRFSLQPSGTIQPG